MNPGECVIVFDTDGTLVDGRRVVIDAIAEGLAATYNHFQLPPTLPDLDRIGLAMGLPSPLFYRTAFDPATVPAALRDAFCGEFEVRSTRAEIAALRRGDTQLYDGAEDTLSVLADLGFDLALFSNAAEPRFQTMIEVHDLDRWFSATLSLEYAVRRRLARNKEGMVRHLACDHRQIVVIGDRHDDIAAGQALNALTVGCRFGFGEPGELAAADWQIDRLTDILQIPLVLGRPALPSAERQDEARG